MKNIKEVRKYIDSIKPIFLCEEFDLDVLNVKKEDEESSGAAATFFVRYDYLDARIVIYPCFYKQELLEQKKILIHEMCHFVTCLQKKLIDKLLEGKLVTELQATEAVERENSWMEKILWKNFPKQLGL